MHVQVTVGAHHPPSILWKGEGRERTGSCGGQDCHTSPAGTLSKGGLSPWGIEIPDSSVERKGQTPLKSRIRGRGLPGPIAGGRADPSGSLTLAVGTTAVQLCLVHFVIIITRTRERQEDWKCRRWCRRVSPLNQGKRVRWQWLGGLRKNVWGHSLGLWTQPAVGCHYENKGQRKNAVRNAGMCHQSHV